MLIKDAELFVILHRTLLSQAALTSMCVDLASVVPKENQDDFNAMMDKVRDNIEEATNALNGAIKRISEEHGER